MKKIIVVAIFALWAQNAHAEHKQDCLGTVSIVPDGVDVVCSATWRFRGQCSGSEDMWNGWSIDGQTSPRDVFIRPWSREPILIIGVELTKLRNARWYEIPNRLWNQNREWFMVGSTLQPDAVIWLGPGESHTRLLWPKGFGQPWPAAVDAKPVMPNYGRSGELISATGDLVDLHGQCWGGSVSVLLTLYYSPEK
jgi:hypothetical protein